MMSKSLRAFLSVTLLSAFLMASSAARAQVTSGSVVVGADSGYIHTSISNDPNTHNSYTAGATGGYDRHFEAPAIR